MPDSANPEQLLKQLTAMTAGRPTRPRTFIQANAAAILAALNAGHTGIDLYRAFAAAGHPPPMSLRQFRRYLARLRAQEPGTAPSALTAGPDPAARARQPTPAHPASPPPTLRWDPLADDEDIH
ncbi:hypothetical protein ThidrDRAFT_1132 [Thiorhodococcus drewsii AZ1]|uniref:Uncharacterized protein n=1 Tax=Thiorhodococcus drewsii AZ1 TaxID=765913 RepID=G2DYM0_9GAMM|nr:hypothetical protein [Thiorhodococcus drewsii]EGV32647.1 hypothetical protein ThidrDRAFT_1132 [Thiorhodococcus drewsii AZ1]